MRVCVWCVVCVIGVWMWLYLHVDVCGEGFLSLLCMVLSAIAVGTIAVAICAVTAAVCAMFHNIE